MKKEQRWTYEIARPEGRVWLQSTQSFDTADAASIALGLYLALTPEESGSFIGRVVLASPEPIEAIISPLFLK